MDLTLSEGYARWRQLGVRAGTAAVVGVVVGHARAHMRRTRLRLRPLAVGAAECEAALGGNDPRVLLRGAVLDAMPTVRAFERSLEQLSDSERSELLQVAERVRAHVFDLLGSGPTELGPTIDWSCDFKSGRCWPLEHISRIIVSYPDNSDIKIPWELSRFQHLPVLAAAWRLTGDRQWLDEIRAELEDWIASNPVEFGVNWACTMDVAIRAANWVAALALIADAAADEPWVVLACESLLLHGRFIRTHLEWTPVRGNHYLSDIVGLLCVSALFSAGTEGRNWASWAASELVEELHHQVRDDGTEHEASIPYHRLVAELLICGFQAADALAPSVVAADDRRKIDRMLLFVRDYTRPDGLAPQVGDADDGRFLPLGDYGRSDPRSHIHLFAQAGRRYEPAKTHAHYPNGGYWIARCGRLYVLVRCGDVGGGWHAHNDALSFELSLGRQPIVIDPGSYVYTADPAERTRFRSTAFHSTLELDGVEQNPISSTRLFSIEDRRHAEALQWGTTDDAATFVGRHRGYETLAQPALYTRRLEARDGVLVVTDIVTSSGVHRACWTFPLAPCEVVVTQRMARATFESGDVVEIVSSDVDFELVGGWFSPSYGRRYRTPFVRAHRQTCAGEDVTRITLRCSGTL